MRRQSLRFYKIIRSNKAFTLFEVLVVLMLLAMVTSVLFEGLSYTLGVQRGLLTQLRRQQSGILQSFWVRTVLSGTGPVALPREGEFSGRSDLISGVSIATLGGIPGAPGQYSMTFRKEDNILSLLYTDQYGSRFSLGEWQDSDGSFMFIDNFKTFSRWPPKSVIKEYLQLPETIMIRIDQPNGVRYWAAGVSGVREPQETTLQTGI